MSFNKSAVAGTLAWMASITALHVALNVGGCSGFRTGGNFRVGFLPVT